MSNSRDILNLDNPATVNTASAGRVEKVAIKSGRLAVMCFPGVKRLEWRVCKLCHEKFFVEISYGPGPGYWWKKSEICTKCRWKQWKEVGKKIVEILRT